MTRISWWKFENSLTHICIIIILLNNSRMRRMSNRNMLPAIFIRTPVVPSKLHYTMWLEIGGMQWKRTFLYLASNHIHTKESHIYSDVTLAYMHIRISRDYPVCRREMQKKQLVQDQNNINEGQHLLS